MPKFMNELIEYFDLQSVKRNEASLHSGDAPDLAVLPQYTALVFGVMVQPFLENFRKTGSWNADLGTMLNWGVFALLVGLIIFPSVYRKSFDPGQPKFVQFCVVLVAGIGWQALFATAAKAIK